MELNKTAKFSILYDLLVVIQKKNPWPFSVVFFLHWCPIFQYGNVLLVFVVEWKK